MWIAELVEIIEKQEVAEGLTLTKVQAGCILKNICIFFSFLYQVQITDNFSVSRRPKDIRLSQKGRALICCH